MKPFVHVSKNTGMNPVARAVARTALKNAAQGFQIRLYVIPEGEDVLVEARTAVAMLTVCIDAMRRSGSQVDPVMRGALSAAQQCVDRGGIWHTQDAVALDRGLQRLLDIYPGIPAQHVASAWRAWKENL